MPASVHDSSSTDDRSTTRDLSDDDFPDEDAESDYQSCGSYISDEDEEHTAEEYVDGEVEIFQYMENLEKWEPIQASDVRDLVGDSRTSIEGISRIEYVQWFDALVDSKDRFLDAIAVLAETVGGPAKVQWRNILLYRKNRGAENTYFFLLQILLNLIMFGKGAWSDNYWLKFHAVYITSQRMYHLSFTSSLFQGRIQLDWSPDRPWKDLAQVMQIALPYFRQMNARIDALSKLRNVGYSSDSSDSPSIFGPTSIASLVTCLDIAESVAKLVPVFGAVLEGVCGILRKTVQAAEVARAARDECKALAEHTACITLAIINEIGSTSNEPAISNANIFDLCVTIGDVERRITKLSTYGRFKYVIARGKINAEVRDLRVRVDNARIAFKIRSDITAAGLLYDLRRMQTRLESRVEDIYVGQKATHNMLRTILVEVRGRRTGDAYIDEAEQGRM